MFLKDKKKINILSIGWVGQGDFGDEVMAYVLRLFLKNYANVKSITYYQRGRYPFFHGQDDLNVFSLHNFETKNVFRFFLDKIFLRKFNVLFIGGGSILHSMNSIGWKLNILRRLKKIKQSMLFSACVGVSVGPLSTESEENICRELLEEVNMSIFRDNYSFRVAKKISSNNKLYTSLDTSLLLPDLCKKELDEAMSSIRDENLVGVLFIKKKDEEGSFKNSFRFNRYLEIINNVLVKGKNILLVNLYIGNAYPDIELNKKLKEKSKFPERVKIYTFNGDIFKTIKELNRCSYLISMRLHGVIFAYMLKIPFISLAYNRKNQDFCEAINYPKGMSFNFYEKAEVEPILHSLDSLFEQKGQIFNGVLSPEKAEEIVKNNFNLLLGELNKL